MKIIRDPSHVLDEITQVRLPQDLNLLPGIEEKIQVGKRSTRKSAVIVRFATLSLVVLLLIAVFTQPGVASILKELLGYIPGVGTVDQTAKLRVLSSPVTDSRAGYTIIVESALLDSTHTVLTYQIAGQIPSWDDPSLQPRMCQEHAFLRLADGEELQNMGSEMGLGDGKSEWQTNFPAVPAGEYQATLVLPCLPELPVGEGPQNWEILLTFAPALPEMTVYPVVDLPTPKPENPGEPVSGDGIQLSLQSTAKLEDGYYLKALLTWQNDSNMYDIQIYPDAIHLFDAAGQEVSIWQADQAPLFAPAEMQSMALNLQTGPILAPGAAQLVVDYVGVSMQAATQFSFDLGESPQPGQTWQVNQDLFVNGFLLKALSAEAIQTPPGEPVMLMIYFETEPDILMVTALDPEHEILDTGGSPNSEDVPFRVGWHYKDGFPEGVIMVKITSISLRRSGPWSVEWTPITGEALREDTPSAEASALPQNQPDCLGESSLPETDGELPAGLGGRVAYSKLTGEHNELFVSNLDGSEQIGLGQGAYPHLSYDGKRVVYSGADDGLHIRELEGGGDLLIPGTIQEGIYNSWPRWSPNGQQIAFDRVSNQIADIYLVNADGTNLHAVLNGAEDERFLGWAPGSEAFSYIVTLPNSQSIRVLNLQTGDRYEVGQLAPGTINASISPDGKRLLYSNEQGMFLMDMVTDQITFIAANTPNWGRQIHPIWNPDGQWIAMTYWEAEDDALPGIALLQPDKCQVILLTEQVGDWLTSWAP
jgi:hypothetical protein